MPTISSGSVIRRLGANNEPGVAGCLVQFPGDPEKLFWLTAGHVLLSSTAEQFDRMEAKDLPGETIGRLFGWTSLDGQVTVDAALVWVNPKLVSPETQGFIAPTDINPLPDIGDKLHLFVKGQEHVGVIEDNGAPVSITVTGQDFNQEFTFQGQITCTGFETLDCDGAIAVDENNLVVGMVVGRGVMVGLGERTVVTPIEGILKHPDWGPGEPLQLVTAVPPTAIAPLVPAPKPVRPPALSSTLEDALRAAARSNEIGKKSPYELCFAEKGRSGCSFGFMQGDLAAGQPIVQKTFRDALAAAGLPPGQIDSFAARLSVPLLRNPLGPDDTKLINKALNSRDGQKLVDAMDAVIFADVRQDLDLCISKAEASDRHIAPEAQIPMLLWINMTGHPTTLLDWLSGRDVTLSGRVVTKPGTTIDGQEMERYLTATKFFTENRENLDHFRTSVQEGLALLGADSGPSPMPSLMGMARVDQSGLPGKTRDMPIAPGLEVLLGRAAAAADIDVVFVTSGGQPGSSGKSIGSTRHNDGRAADVQLRVGGQALTFTDQDGGRTIETFITAAAALGAIGIGAGVHYMGNRTIHVGFGETPEDSRKIVWGAEGRSANAPRWLRQAAQQGWNSPLPPPLSAKGEHEEEDA